MKQRSTVVPPPQQPLHRSLGRQHTKPQRPLRPAAPRRAAPRRTHSWPPAATHARTSAVAAAFMGAMRCAMMNFARFVVVPTSHLQARNTAEWPGLVCVGKAGRGGGGGYCHHWPGPPPPQLHPLALAPDTLTSPHNTQNHCVNSGWQSRTRLLAHSTVPPPAHHAPPRAPPTLARPGAPSTATWHPPRAALVRHELQPVRRRDARQHAAACRLRRGVLRVICVNVVQRRACGQLATCERGTESVFGVVAPCAISWCV